MGNYLSKPYGGNSYAKLMGMTAVPIRRPRRPGTRRYAPPAGPIGQQALSGLSRLAKKARSYTVTKRKTRRKRGGRFSSKGNSTSWYKKMYAHRLPKQVFRQLVGHQGWTDNLALQSVSTLGNQQIAQLSIMTKTDLAAIKTAVQGVSDAKTCKIFMKSYNSQITMRSGSNQPQKVRIYNLVCRRDTPGTSLDTPIEAWTKGLADLSLGLPNTALLTDIFAHPKRSDEFRAYWKVAGVEDVELSPGDTHTHTVKIKMNKMLDTTVLDNNVGLSIAGWTHYIMIVHYGSLVNSNVDNTRITYAPVKLDLAIVETIRFAYLEKNTAAYNIINKPITAANPGETFEAYVDQQPVNIAPASN